MKNYWLDEPEEHDYPAAADYLDLLYRPEKVKELVAALRKAEVVQKKAKDILRASRLALLPDDNYHVKHNIVKAKNGEKLSPILLIRGEPLTIADGYHRLCAIYYLSEDLEVPCKIV